MPSDTFRYVTYTRRQCLLSSAAFSNAAPVGNSDICLNGKRLTAADLFSLTGNSILKHDLRFWIDCN
ncbi:hypothetical protein DW974_19230 [Lachnospiraceae bacterium AM48-27BH]|nr:hypothetical protein DW974_19230 [Lachnospiraceae bacterium AM48-27BH]